MSSRSLFQKEGFEIRGCSSVSELKLRSTSSSVKNCADEITWITWKTEQNMEIWPFLNSLIEIWVWENGPKIDPATGVSKEHSTTELGTKNFDEKFGDSETFTGANLVVRPVLHGGRRPTRPRILPRVLCSPHRHVAYCHTGASTVHAC